MNKKLLIRKTHRYIGLLVSLQLLAWTLGGIWFTWNDIDDIHGDYLRNFDIPEVSQPSLSTSEALQNIADLDQLKSLQVTHFLQKPAYRISYKSKDNKDKNIYIDGTTGKTLSSVSEQQAIDEAKVNAKFEAPVSQVELITETSKHHEYRGKALPVWAVTFDYPESPTFYISNQHGRLSSVRHTSWRIFDFFWMLHTMDYEGRDDFGNWLIKIFSVIALITAISGIVLFIISSRRRIKKVR